MCGIFGLLSLDETPVSSSMLWQGIQTLKHRGPDKQTVWMNTRQTVGLAHARLSILDLSSNGDQPFQNKSGSIQVVANGELYNFETLKNRLVQQGYRFNSKTDCEILPHLYECDGVSFCEQLDGMFALAIWDGTQLVLGRDAYGKKPLFYHYDPGKRFVFASEIKALIPFIRQKTLNQDGLIKYLTTGYLAGEHSIFSGIREVPAGSSLAFNPLDGNMETKTYWHWPNQTPVLSSPQSTPEVALSCKTEEDWINGFREHLIQAVEKRLVSDVPLGAFLSGGIDSCSVVALMQYLKPDIERHTFSIQFNEPSYDTPDHIPALLKQCKLNHHRIQFSPDDFEACFDSVMLSQEGLLADLSLLPMYKLAKEAGQTLRVVLTGDGADELLGGYDTYKATGIAKAMGGFRQPAGKLLEWLLPFFPAGSNRYKLNRSVLLQQLGHGLCQPDLPNVHAGWRQIFSFQEIIQELLNPAVVEQYQNTSHFDVPLQHWNTASGDWFQKAQAMDIATWMRYSILPKVDRATMAYGVEARSPFLDRDLAAFCARLPTALKARHPKWILKKAMTTLLPEQVIWQKKSGFNTPLSRWFLEEPTVQKLARHWLLSEQALSHGLFSVKWVQGLWNQHTHQDCHLKLWNLMVFNAWYFYHMR
jgi:asparagine synthase (glutamine-hydrolysing)